MRCVSKQHVVILTEHLSDEAATWLGERCQLMRCAYDSAEFRAALPSASGLVVRTYTMVDESLLIHAPKLRVVGRAGVGLDNIDVAACRNRGIEVVYTPDANTQAVVEYVMCLLADALRPRITLDHAVDATTWNRLREVTVAQRQMNELTLGILGFGRVGQRVTAVARALGLWILYNDLLDFPIDQRHGGAPVSAPTLFQQSDVISIHIDGRASNRRFVNSALISLMKSDVVFINTSRGFVVDNLELAEFLRIRPQALALLDVHDPEPFDAKYPLLGLPNAKLYPHLASRTEPAMNNMSWVVKDVIAVLEGRPPEFPAPDQDKK